MTLLFGRKVRIKDMRQLFFFDASSIIANFDNHFFVVIKNPNRNFPTLNAFTFSGFLHLLFSIVDDVKQGLHKLIFIPTHHQISSFWSVDSDIDIVVFNRMADNFHHGFNRFAYIKDTFSAWRHNEFLKIINRIGHVAYLYHDVMYIRAVLLISTLFTIVHMLLSNRCNFHQRVFPLMRNRGKYLPNLCQFGLLDDELLVLIFLKLNGTQLFLAFNALVDVMNES